MTRTTALFASSLLLVAACTKPEPEPSGEEAGDAGTDTAGESDSSSEDEVGETADTTDEGESPSDFCVERDLPVAPLMEGTGGDFGEIAGDFTVETTFGEWNLAANFTGCDTYVFVNHLANGTSDQLRSSFTADLFTRSPDNVHYFFLNNDADPAAGAIAWQTKIGQTLAPLTDEEQKYWIDHVHFVEDAPADITGSVGWFFAQNPNVMVAAIDRFQRWDFPNSTSDTGGGSFAQTGAVLAYTPRWYNWYHAQELELEAQTREPGFTEVALLDNVYFPPDGPAGNDGPFANTYNHNVWPANFPDAASLAEFDTMEVVVTGTCGPYGDDDCGHWDYEAWVELCPDQACEGETTEVFRWITPYARIGERKWVFDATPMLGLIQDGGEQFFRFGMRWNMNPSVWDMRFRLRDTGQGSRPVETVRAYRANKGFNDTYNEWETVEFTPPASATKVELVAIISGHGQDEGNCAEWCNHQHEFTINGTDVHLREFPGEVTAQRCAEAVDEGVVPGQWGNWTPGRAGWCPGQPVQPWRVDITDEVTLGQVNTLDYRGLFGGQPVTGNRGRILFSTYVAYYE
ncbi:peptide-N-glycosidase F-related protein [Plesiocystis pacifica]|uniref:peptide-N-glycosidase F-related protein n=1 Tax=Plesiocystis pacifica TaxID=191768 RepID=UPI000A309D75|nr:peptide-N-glycosidase F-related protein [Plesiocystis pacifica]